MAFALIKRNTDVQGSSPAFTSLCSFIVAGKSACLKKLPAVNVHEL